MCLCESYEASASGEKMLHLVVAGAAAGAAGAAGALGLHIVINGMAIMVIFPIVLSSCPSVFPGSRAKVFYVPGPADAAFHRRPFGPVLTRSYRGPSRPAFAGGCSSTAAPQVWPAHRWPWCELPRCGVELALPWVCRASCVQLFSHFLGASRFTQTGCCRGIVIAIVVVILIRRHQHCHRPLDVQQKKSSS